MIDGDPGAGKTTFIKRLCYIWAKSLLHPEERDTEDEYLHKYTLVIPIILRLISKQNTLIDLFTSQLQCLNICEICALVNLLESKPNTFLLLLDGYDEYKGQSVISKVLTKEECTNILTVTTSRPHAVEQLRRQISQAVDQLIKLCGFSEEQIKQYIRQFCKYHKLTSEQGEELIRTLFEDRTNMLDIASIPIRTEMICIVWAVYGKLGETLADLYEMFVIHLITHWENKQKTKQGFKIKKMSPKQVIKQSETFLIKIGQLAYTWEKHNRLRIVFSTEELEEILGEDFNKVINIGILSKSHPSNILQESKWSFPHLTIQEYFVAFMLGNDEDDTFKSSLITRCKNYRVLRRYEVIFEFLCCKYPSAANKILTELLLEEKDEQKCQELFDYVCKVYHYYTKNTLDIPLPCYLKLKNDMNVDMMNTLLEKRQKPPNLRHLTIENPVKYERFMDVPYIEGFSVTIINEEKKLVSNKIRKLSKLTSISINSKVSLQSTDHTDILKNISCDRLTDLSVTAPDALEAVADSIQRFKALQKLHVDDTAAAAAADDDDDDDDDDEDEDDTDRSSNNTHGYKILSVLRDNNNIKEVSLCVPDLDGRIIQKKFNMKVILQVKEKTLKKDSLRKTVSGLDFTGGLYKLDLSGNNLKDEGESLGELMARMTTLRVLDVWKCNIQAYTVQAMVQTIREIKVTSGLHTLYMARYRYDNNNKLHTGGCYLGELVALIPDLYTLDLDDCDLTDTDLVNMSDAVPATTNIHTLNLQGNNLGYNSEGLTSLLSHTPNIQDDISEGLVCLLSHTPHIQALAVGGIDSYGSPLPAPVPSLCRAADAGSLTSLHVLDMSDSKLQPGSLEKLGQHLQYMNKLQVINLDRIHGVKPEDYQHVYSNLPPSIQHLSVCHYNLDVPLILEYKDNLNHLHRLNVYLYDDSDIELLQEVLEQNNPHIHVYDDDDEDTWRMYVTDRDE